MHYTSLLPDSSSCGEVVVISVGSKGDETPGTQLISSVALRGTPREMGYAYGCAYREEIRQSVAEVMADCSENLVAGGLSCRRLSDGLGAALPKEYLHELEGIAAGAGIGVSDLLLLNAVAGWRDAASHAFTVPAFLAAWERATVNGDALLGGLWGSTSSSGAIWVERHPSGGRPFGYLTRPGLLGGYIGIADGRLIGLTIHAETPDRQYEGLPSQIALRISLEESYSPREARNRLLGLSHAGGATLVLAGDELDSIQVHGLEVSANLARDLPSELDTVAGVGLFLHPEMAGLQASSLSPTYSDLLRANHTQIQNLLRANVGWIGVEKSLSSLSLLMEQWGFESEGIASSAEGFWLLSLHQERMWLCRREGGGTDCVVMRFDQLISREGDGTN